MILIISNKWDVTADFIVRELKERDYPYIRINTEDMLENNLTITISDFSMLVEKGNGQKVNLNEEIGAIWNRRPGKPYEFVSEGEKPDEGTLEYIREQWSAWIESLQLLDDVNWVNHPIENHKMESKIRQLLLAEDVGFEIPETIITNDSSVASEFLENQENKCIAKALSSPLISTENQEEFVFSQLIEEKPGEKSLKQSPTIFQEPIIPKTDYRVTVVGEKVLAAKITKKDGKMPIDWRTEKTGISFEQVELPDKIESLCREYVEEAGLVFGAIDLVRSDNEFKFLEINPNGEWGWLEKPWGLPIAENLTKLLIEKDGVS